MKDKLTISDLSPYLPYELKIFIDKSGIATLECLSNTGLNEPFLFSVKERHGLYGYNVWKPKPLLIPISEFGAWDEIFMKGLTHCGWEEEMFSLAFEYHDDAVECLIYVNDIKYNCTFSYINGNVEFHGDIMFNQLAAFNEMFRKHIDLGALIEKGLALNKLTFKP